MQLPEVIGELTKLTSLDLSYCKYLKALPETLGNLTALQILGVSYCDMLESLPNSIGDLTALTRLDVSYCCSLKQLPKSVGGLSSLKSLSLSCCTRLAALPDSVSKLRGLRQLSLRGCRSMLTLPDNFGQLTGLQVLDLGFCTALTDLPGSCGGLQSLEELRADSSALATLPASFGKLYALYSLDIGGCSGLSNLPDCCVQLTRLEVFRCAGCAAVPQLPPQRIDCCQPGNGYQQLRWVLKQQQQRAAVRKLANQQEPMLNTLERMSWLVVLLATATFVAYLSPPGGVGDDKQVLVSNIASCYPAAEGPISEGLTGFTKCAMLVFFVLDGLSFGLSFGCLITIVMLSMPRIQWADEQAEAGRFYILLLCTWLYLAVVTGFAAFVASGLAVNRQAAVVVGPVVPGMVLLLLGAVFFWHRFQSLYPGWDALWAARPLQYRELAPVETDVELGQAKFWQEWPKYLSGLQQAGKGVAGPTAVLECDDAESVPLLCAPTPTSDKMQQYAPAVQVLCVADG